MAVEKIVRIIQTDYRINLNYILNENEEIEEEILRLIVPQIIVNYDLYDLYISI